MNALDMIKENYVSFSEYTMRFRTYPCIYDGMKLAQRRILVAAQNNIPATTKSKLSTLVGATMAYHPHGDTTDTIVKMAGEFQTSFPLFDTQGNFGDGYGNPAAAPRYLELKLADKARKLYFSKVDQAPKENFEVQPEPVYLPTLFPLAFLQGCFSVGQGTPNVLIPELEFEDLKRYVQNYIKTGQTEVTEDNFVRFTDFAQIKNDSNKFKSVMDVLNKGKGTVTYEPTVDIVGDKIIIRDLYVLAQFPTLFSLLQDYIDSNKIDVWDESTTERVWVVEKVKYRSFDMQECADKIRKAFTYREKYVMYFHDLEGRVRPYSLGEVIEECYGMYRDAYIQQLNKELDDRCVDLAILQCLAELSKNKNALDIIIDNSIDDEQKVELLEKQVVGYTQNLISRCLQKPIRQLKEDKAAIEKAEKDIQQLQYNINNVADVILSQLDKF